MEPPCNPLREVEHALRRDDVAALSSALQQHGLGIDGWLLQAGQQRSLLQLASCLAAPTCVAALLASGAAEVNQQSPSDGNTALHCACSSASSSTARVIALLVRAGAEKALCNHAGRTACELLEQGTAQAACAAEEAPPPEDCDLLRPEYCTDVFRMFSFKIDCCPRLAESHDWTLCPFQHPGEKARRRDPRCYKYHGVPCPDFRKGTCKRGDACTYAHGVFECWLHPSRYRTQLCKEGAACRRSVCFFAHAVDQLREPTMTGAACEPDSPRGLLASPEESSDTPRSWSPAPATSEDSVSGLMHCSTESLPKGFMAVPAGAAAVQRHLGRRSADSSMSSTPVLEGSLGTAVSMSSDSLQRTLSSLSLSSEDLTMSQVVALQHVAAGGGWPMQAHTHHHLSLLGGCSGPLGAGLGGMLMPDVAEVQAAVQAAAVQHHLAMMQADTNSLLAAAAADPSGLLAVAAGARQPLLPLSLNLGHHYHQANAVQPSCYGLGL